MAALQGVMFSSRSVIDLFPGQDLKKLQCDVVK